MSTWPRSTQLTMWRAYIEASLLLETELDEDLRAAAGMSMIDYHVLLVLSESPASRLRMKDLAERMVFSPSRVTYQVTTMERRGWVLRQPSCADKRVTYAVLTATGLEALRATSPHHMATVQSLFIDHLDADEQRVLTEVFTRLHHRLVTARRLARTSAADSAPDTE